jgi:NADH:ubiquinone oxidoreductase subunit E
VSKDFHTPECVLFVCCGGKCKKRGGKQLYKQLKSTVKGNSLKRQVKVIKTGCTDNCKKGPVVIQMPENIWHFQVGEDQAMSLLTSGYTP